MAIAANLVTMMTAKTDGFDSAMERSRKKLDSFRNAAASKSDNKVSFGGFGIGGEGLMMGGQMIQLAVAAKTVEAGFGLAKIAVAAARGDSEAMAAAFERLPIIGGVARAAFELKNYMDGTAAAAEKAKIQAEQQKKHMEAMKALGEWDANRRKQAEDAGVAGDATAAGRLQARRGVEEQLAALRKIQQDDMESGRALPWQQYAEREAQAIKAYYKYLEDAEARAAKEKSDEDAKRIKEDAANKRVQERDALRSRGKGLIEQYMTDAERFERLKKEAAKLLEREDIDPETYKRILAQNAPQPIYTGAETDTALMRYGADGATDKADTANNFLQQILQTLRDRLNFNLAGAA